MSNNKSPIKGEPRNRWLPCLSLLNINRELTLIVLIISQEKEEEGIVLLHSAKLVLFSCQNQITTQNQQRRDYRLHCG